MDAGSFTEAKTPRMERGRGGRDGKIVAVVALTRNTRGDQQVVIAVVVAELVCMGMESSR
jgi:hypothetical protein